MEVTSRSRLLLRFQNIAFVALFLGIVGMLGWLSTQYTYQADWTAGHRNTLSKASRELLARIHGPLTITAYARQRPQLRQQIQDLVGRYQRIKPDIHLVFVNPDTVPAQVRDLGITVDGELVIQYKGRSEQLTHLSESGLTNALLRVASGAQRWAVFLTGHGERDPDGRANFDLGDFGRLLKNKGVTVQTLNLATTASIPRNTTVLVIASPRVNLLPGEVDAIRAYVRHGGNLLWLQDPGSLHGLEPVAKELGIRILPGTIVDPAAVRLFGAPFALVTHYPDSPITRGMDLLTLFPEAAGIQVKKDHGDWNPDAFLTSSAQSWDHVGALSGTVAYNPGKDQHGPLNIGVALTRSVKATAPAGVTTPHGKTGARATETPAANTPNPEPRSQRVVVIGNGDFLSNAYLGNAGNANLGLKVFQWLTHNDQFINVPAKTAPDLTLTLSSDAQAIIGFGLLLVLPALLLGSGIVIWYRRRAR
ncbi:MAG TPA: GldG family protein [Gammaproteobacteria bacterium]|nr:GldG family protein [Gammaproteobacteria bacterium]